MPLTDHIKYKAVRNSTFAIASRRKQCVEEKQKTSYTADGAARNFAARCAAKSSAITRKRKITFFCVLLRLDRPWADLRAAPLAKSSLSFVFLQRIALISRDSKKGVLYSVIPCITQHYFKFLFRTTESNLSLIT